MTISTQIGYATVQDISVRGENLSTEIIPHSGFVDMLCVCMLAIAGQVVADRANMGSRKAVR